MKIILRAMVVMARLDQAQFADATDVAIPTKAPSRQRPNSAADVQSDAECLTGAADRADWI